MKVHIARRDEEIIGRYKVTILYDAEDKILGAIVEHPRAARPVYLAINEEIRIKLPRQVKSYLKKLGFKIVE
ncbi:MAG: hypothetical protein ABWW69_05660 [Pyrodictiaceae archaeon]